MDFNYFQDKRLIEAFRKSDKAYLIDIDKILNSLRKDIPYGAITFTIKLHAGKITDMVITEINRRIRYNLGRR